MEGWKSLKPFAPGVRSSIVMVKLSSRDEMFGFIRDWKDEEFKYKEHVIRARADKTPEQRKANAKIYNISEYLNSKFMDKEFDSEFKNAPVWLGDGEVVKWDSDSESFLWQEDVINKAGVVIDREEAEKHTH